MAEKQLALKETSQLTIDIKRLIGILAIILSIAGVYFTLTSQIAQLQLDVIRMQDAVEMNEEFRIKWPRGELGALPDDAVQDLNIEYLQDDVKKLQEEVRSGRCRRLTDKEVFEIWEDLKEEVLNGRAVYEEMVAKLSRDNDLFKAFDDGFGI